MSNGGYSKPKTNASNLPWSKAGETRTTEIDDYPEMFLDEEGGESYDDTYDFSEKDNSKYDEVISSYIEKLDETPSRRTTVEKRRRTRNSEGSTSNQYRQPVSALDLLRTKVQLKNPKIKIRSHEEKENLEYSSSNPPTQGREGIKIYEPSRSRKPNRRNKRDHQDRSDSSEVESTRTREPDNYSTEERNHPGGGVNTKEKFSRNRSQAQRKQSEKHKYGKLGSSERRNPSSATNSGNSGGNRTNRTNQKYSASKYKTSSKTGSKNKSNHHGGREDYIDDLYDQYDTDEHMLAENHEPSETKKRTSSSSSSNRKKKTITNLPQISKIRKGNNVRSKYNSTRRNQQKNKRKTKTNNERFQDDNDAGDQWGSEMPSESIQEAHDVSNFDDVPIGGSGMYEVPGSKGKKSNHIVQNTEDEEDEDLGRYGKYGSKRRTSKKKKSNQMESKYGYNEEEDDRYGDSQSYKKPSNYPKKKRNRSKSEKHLDQPIRNRPSSPPIRETGIHEESAVGGGTGIDVPEYAEVQLVKCPHCPRKFRDEILKRHIDTIHKKKPKKRKVFTMTEKRVGKEAKSMFVTLVKKEKRGLVKKPMSKWRKQHEQFQSALKNTSGSVETYDDRVPCPHCGRKFNELAAERHIPKCETIRNKPTGITRRERKYDPFRDRAKKKLQAKVSSRSNTRSNLSRTYGGGGGSSAYSSGLSGKSNKPKQSSSRYSGYRSTLRGGRTVGKKIRRRF